MNRKKITILLFLIVTLSGYSQISVSTKETPILIGKSSQVTCEQIGNTYIFTYRDLKFTQLKEFKSFQFNEENEDFNKLYELMQAGLKTKPEENIVLELPNCTLKLEFLKSMGVGNVRFIHTENGITGISSWLTKKKLAKLFGKK